MADSVVNVPITTPPAESEVGSSKITDTIETAADLSTIVTDQSRIENEEIEFEDYLKCSFSYDKAGRTPVCVDKIIEVLPEDAAVLDCGCGTGNYMTSIVKSGKCKSYIGMDVNEGMLYHARKKAAALRNDDTISTDVTTVAGSLLEALPFEDNVFDCVVINQVIHHLVDVRVFDRFKYVTALFAEINRVLKPGGVFSINTCAHDQKAACWWVAAMPTVLEKLQIRNPDIDELKKMIIDAGFTGFTFVRDDTPLLGDAYWKYEGCFSEEYRSASSTWSLASDEEYAKAMANLKYALREERETFDNIARNSVAKTGHTIQVFSYKKSE